LIEAVVVVIDLFIIKGMLGNVCRGVFVLLLLDAPIGLLRVWLSEVYVVDVMILCDVLHDMLVDHASPDYYLLDQILHQLALQPQA
jgi:hypothetical protein